VRGGGGWKEIELIVRGLNGRGRWENKLWAPQPSEGTLDGEVGT